MASRRLFPEIYRSAYECIPLDLFRRRLPALILDRAYQTSLDGERVDFFGTSKRVSLRLAAISALHLTQRSVRKKDRDETRQTFLRLREKREAMLNERQRAALPVAHTIELRDRDKGHALFRVPEWQNPPEIIEWQGRRFVKHTNSEYREAVTFSLYVGYNAEPVQEEITHLTLRR